jgi:hypothetical protein
MLHNQKIRDVIDTITSKAVLILGRFTDKAVLDALREELRKRNYLPILFDFSVPATRDITETVSLLARMARFVVADITDARSTHSNSPRLYLTCRPSLCSRYCWRAAPNTVCLSTSNDTLGSWRPTGTLPRSV